MEAAASGMGISPAVDAAAVGGKGVEGTVEGATAFLGSFKAAGRRAAIAVSTEETASALAADGRTVLALVVDEAIAGMISMRAEPRVDLGRFAAQGVATAKLIGDDPCAAVARSPGGMEVCAGLLLGDKHRIVAGMRTRTARSLRSATGSTTRRPSPPPTWRQRVDAAIPNGRIGSVAKLIDLLRRTPAIVRQNVAVTPGLKLLSLATTVAGIAEP